MHRHTTTLPRPATWSAPLGVAFVGIALLLPTGIQAQSPELCFAEDTPPWRVAEIAALTAANDARASLTVPQGQTRFQGLPGTRWTSTATNGSVSGQGEPITLTWSYIPDGTVIPAQFPQLGEMNDPSTMRAWLNGIYGDFATWHAHFVQVFDRWSQLTGIRYVYEPNDDGAAMFNSTGALGVRGDLRIGAHRIDGNSNVLAYNFFPNGGDMVLDANDSSYNNLSNNSRVLRNILAHEHGHGLGMSHVCPLEGRKLMEPFLATGFDGPQFDDILGGQRGYGDPAEFDGDLFGAAATYTGPVSERSIDDNSDVDWYVFNASSGESISVTLAPDGTTYLNGPQNDLAIEIRDSGGVNVLASANAEPAGGTEAINGFVVPASGTYYVRVSGADNAAQLYILEVDGAVLFVDGFESGNTSSWSQTVP